MLSSIGFDNVLGFLDGGIEAWNAEGFKVTTVNLVND